MNLLTQTTQTVRAAFGPEAGSITVTRAAFGLFFSGVKLDTGHGGLCFTPVKELPQAVCCPSSAEAMPLSGRLSGRTAAEYLDWITDPNILKRTLGIATLNALSALYWDRRGHVTLDGRRYEVHLSRDAFDELDISSAEKITVVGALVPILKKIKESGRDYTVLEMDPRTLKGSELDHYLPADRAAEVVPRSDALVITGTTLINGSIDGLLAQARPGARILVTGPTASMLPDAFFVRGVTMLGGIVVTDPDAALDIISEGGSGYHLFGESAERIVVVPSE
jgi:uncharacterized protein (DUF4213/DUF364 family)